MRSLVAGVGFKEVVQLDALVHHTLYLPLPQRLRKAARGPARAGSASGCWALPRHGRHTNPGCLQKHMGHNCASACSKYTLVAGGLAML